MHTPTPWYVGQTREWDDNGDNIEQLAIYNREDGIKIAKVETWIGEKERQESENNAALIVNAVNSYEAMREALKEAQVRLFMVDGDSQLYHKIGAALNFAEGKE